MKKILFLLSILLLLHACKEEKRVVKKIDFETDYKFSADIEHKVETDTVPWKYQISASDYATKGDYKNALAHWDLAMGTREITFTEAQVDSINQKYSKVNAAEFIIEQAKKNQIVIINEAHHNSFHRVFTKSLLKELYDQGYTNLGLEALTNNDTLNATLNKRKYPIQETGHYTKDPQFGALVREALEIGYTLFPYENMSNGSGKPREIEQAKNIKKVINSRPNEKFLIHCGYDHALEGTHNSWEKAMAGRLTEYTGINPLTINQVVYSERSQPEFNHPLLKALDIQESSVLIDKDGVLVRYERGEAWSDLAVFHPNTQYVDQRPNWLFDHGNKNVPITLTDIEIEYPVMVLAFAKAEKIHLAVPIDITEVKTISEHCTLALKKGVYNVVVTNGKTSFTFEQAVH